MADLRPALDAITLAQTIRCHARSLDAIADAVAAGIPLPETKNRLDDLTRAEIQAAHDQASAAFRALPLDAKKDRLIAALVTGPAVALLRDLEWSGLSMQTGHSHYPACPSCKGIQRTDITRETVLAEYLGHDDFCRLAGVLRSAEGLVP